MYICAGLYICNDKRICLRIRCISNYQFIRNFNCVVKFCIMCGRIFEKSISGQQWSYRSCVDYLQVSGGIDNHGIYWLFYLAVILVNLKLQAILAQ